MTVLVFKTSITKQEQVSKVEALLTSIPDVSRWNLDLDDCDRILRVVTNGVSPRYVEAALQTAGITCLELDD